MAVLAAARGENYEAAMRAALALSRLGVPPRPALAVARAVEAAHCCDPAAAAVAEERTQLTESLGALAAAADALVQGGQGPRALLWAEYGCWACEWAARGNAPLASALLPFRRRLRGLAKRARAAPRGKQGKAPPPQLPPSSHHLLHAQGLAGGGGEARTSGLGAAAPPPPPRLDPGSPNDF